ncbi:MAG: response regulator [Candidatus Cloacimonetes bacterium]|nr:response regulator [Candidatus Cloacimonadota bacterium]
MKKQTILIVEDEFIVGTSIKRILTALDYRVEKIIGSGEEAIAFCRRKKPDLVIMDITLNGKMDGIQAANIIHRELDIPIIFLTAHSGENIFNEVTASDPFGYIIKPFNDYELKVSVKMALYKYQMEKELKASREFLRLIVDSNPNLIFVKDKLNRYRLVNKSLAEYWGLKPEEVIGKNEKVIIDKLPRELRSSWHQMTGGLGSGGSARGFSTSGERKILSDGKGRWYQLNRKPITSALMRGGVLHILTDMTERKKAEDELKVSYEKLKEILRATVKGLVSAVEIRDPYTAGHQRKVSQLVIALATELGFSQHIIDGLGLSALVHDIGKIFVPIEILTKPGAISTAEFTLIKYHPQAAYDILKTIDFTWPVADTVLQHHERLDGSGYPTRLKGDAIRLEARILAVADVVEAMASHRPYRPSLGIEAALTEIDKYAGIRYDVDIVKACLKLFSDGKFNFLEEPELTL